MCFKERQKSIPVIEKNAEVLLHHRTRGSMVSNYYWLYLTVYQKIDLLLGGAGGGTRAGVVGLVELCYTRFRTRISLESLTWSLLSWYQQNSWQRLEKSHYWAWGPKSISLRRLQAAAMGPQGTAPWRHWTVAVPSLEWVCPFCLLFPFTSNIQWCLT